MVRSFRVCTSSTIRTHFVHVVGLFFVLYVVFVLLLSRPEEYGHGRKFALSVASVMLILATAVCISVLSLHGDGHTHLGILYLSL